MKQKNSRSNSGKIGGTFSINFQELAKPFVGPFADLDYFVVVFAEPFPGQFAGVVFMGIVFTAAHFLMQPLSTSIHNQI